MLARRPWALILSFSPLPSAFHARSSGAPLNGSPELRLIWLSSPVSSTHIVPDAIAASSAGRRKACLKLLAEPGVSLLRLRKPVGISPVTGETGRRTGPASVGMTRCMRVFGSISSRACTCDSITKSTSRQTRCLPAVAPARGAGRSSTPVIFMLKALPRLPVGDSGSAEAFNSAGSILPAMTRLR